MSANVLKSLSMGKYERVLPRIFAGVALLEVRDIDQSLVWSWSPAKKAGDSNNADSDDSASDWSELGGGVEKRQLHSGQRQFRSTLMLKNFGPVGWLIAAYDTESSVSMSTALAALGRAFADAQAFLHDDIELQSECNMLAVELSERYEELNLVYSTKDEVEQVEEGAEALASLVHNCADYLDVELAALICPKRSIKLCNTNTKKAVHDIEDIMELLSTTIYGRVESQVQAVILNSPDDDDRARCFGSRSENLLAYPVVDSHGAVIGMLAVVARDGNREMSNGDRNLLDVMATKASRIIHTHHDSLTGLLTRGGFESMLTSSLAKSRSTNVENVLLHINIDQLHVINDLMGFAEGDSLIRRAAQTIQDVLRDTDVISRLTGGEFCVLLSNCSGSEGQAVAEKLLKAIGDLTVISGNRTLDVSACIGVAPIDRNADSIVNIIAAAEIACKAAKEDGKGRIKSFDVDTTSLLKRSEEMKWVARLQDALRDDQFVLFCQPVMPLLDATEAAHFEMLIRLREPGGKILAPFAFLPAAERYQMMPMIDRWVVRHSLRALGECWDEIGAGDPVFCINLSGQSFTSPGFQAFLMDEIRESGLSPKNICFEVTETVAISHIDEAIGFIKVLREFGCSFSLDDFGAGLSSFGYLKVLPVDYLKIDGSFVREITTDNVSRSMVEAITKIGKTMNLSIIAEFVEDDATQAILRTIGVDYAQGYGVGKPAPLSEILTGLKQDATAASA